MSAGWPRELVSGLVATTAAQTGVTCAVFSLPVLATVAGPGLGVEAHWIGVQIAIIYTAAALVSAGAAGVLRRVGPARTTQTALMFGAVGAGLPVAGVWGAVVGAALLGVGYGLTNPAASQVLDHLAPRHRRNLVFSIKQTGVPLGGAVAGVCLPVLALGVRWQGALLCLAAVLVAGAVGMQRFRAGWDGARQARAAWFVRKGGGLAVLRTPPALGALALVGASYSAMQLALGAFTVAMLVEEFGWSAVQAGFAAASVQLIGAGARLGWAAVADRLRAGFLVLAVVGAGTAAAAALLPLTHGASAPVVFGALCVLGSCSAGWNGVALAQAAALAPEGRAGAAVGAVLAVTFAGVVAGPSVFSVLVAWAHGYSGAFLVLAVSPLLGALLAGRMAMVEKVRR